MNFDEFKALAIESGAREPYVYRRDFGLCFYTEWLCGGITGNSCWGRDPRPVEPDTPETSIKALDAFLLKVAPSINFLQYRNIENDILERDTYDTGCDYYGNYSEYSYLKVTVEGLYNKLVELNLIIPEPSSGFDM